MTGATQALGSPQAAAARVAELQALIAQVEGGPSGTSFGRQLAAASAAAGTTAVAGSVPAAGSVKRPPFADEIEAAAARYGIDPALLFGLVRAESNFDPNATSPAGAQGLTQLMPETARSLGVTNPFDPAQSIDAGARYLRQQLDAFGGDRALALAAYNAGPGAVRQHNGVPPYAETRAYVDRVLGYAEQYRGITGHSRASSLTPTP